MSYDVAAVRAQFPALRAGTAHFDGPGGTQVPEPSARAVADTLDRRDRQPRRGSPPPSGAPRTSSPGARAALADLLGADPRGVVFGRSATQLTFDLARTLANGWGPGDEVVVTRLDHDANVRPWVHGRRGGRRDGPLGRLRPGDRRAHRRRRRRGALRPDAAGGGHRRVQPDRHAARRSPRSPRCVHDAGALLYVDGVHLTAHAPVDVAALGADFFACSPYKFLGPHCGVAGGRRRTCWRRCTPTSCCRRPTPCPSGSSSARCPTSCWPARRRRSTSWPAWRRRPTARRRERLVASMAALEAHEDGLRDAARGGARRAARRHACGRGPPRRTPDPAAHLRRPRRRATPTAFLAERGVNAPAGPFYAIEASRWLGLGDTGGLRVGPRSLHRRRRRRAPARRAAGVPLGPLTRGQGIPSPGRWPAGRQGTADDRAHLARGVQPLVVGRGVAPDVQQVVVGGLADHLGRDAGRPRSRAGTACPG